MKSGKKQLIFAVIVIVVLLIIAFSDITEFIKDFLKNVKLAPEGLVAHYKFENNFNDETGLNNGIGKDVTFTKGKEGLAADFTGKNYLIGLNNYVKISDSSYFEDIDEITISSWIYVDKFNKFNTIINKRYSYLITLDEFGKIIIWNGTGTEWGSNVLVSDKAVSRRYWHHVLIKSNSTGTYSYIDGYLSGKGESIGLIPNNRDPLEIGYRNEEDKIESNFIGYLDELKIWSRDLTENEIKAEFEIASPKSNNNLFQKILDFISNLFR